MSEFRWIGRPLRRVEDRALLTGRATFLDDIKLPNLLYVAILRSPYAHARISSMDYSEASKNTGVKSILTPEDVVRLSKPIPSARNLAKFDSREYCLAVGKVRHVGEPVLAIAASSLGVAMDAMEHVNVEYEPLPSITDPVKALDDPSNLVYEEYGTNLVAHYSERWGDVESAFALADRVLDIKLRLHSYTFPPLETSGVIASYDAAGESLTIWANVQMVGECIKMLSTCLGIPSNKIRLIVPHIGGGFGLKGRPWKMLLIASLLSLKTGYPVKYVESRREHLSTSGRTPEFIFHIRVAAKNNGKILGYKINEVVDEGSSVAYAGTYAIMHKTLINGPYDIRNIQWDAYCVLTNKLPTAPVRAVGKAGIGYLIERAMDIVARELSIDPVTIRMVNYVKSSDMPYINPAGKVYDPADYSRILRKALERFNYYEELKRIAEVKDDKHAYGIGISTSLHAGSAWVGESEAVTIKIDPEGKVYAYSSSPDMGTGQRTVLAQVISEELGVNPGMISFPSNYFDSSTFVWTPFSGTHASKFSGPDVESCARAARLLRERIIKLASHILEANPQDLELVNGIVKVMGTDKQINLADIAKFAYNNPDSMMGETESGLCITYVGGSEKAKEAYIDDPMASYLTYSFSTHIALVKLDLETGVVKIMRYTVIEDCGRVINPLIVEGQVHGAVSNGAEAALLCEYTFNEEGQPLTQTFSDLLLMSPAESFDMDVSHEDNPTSRTIYGARGIGEAGVIGPLAAIPNAVEDALSRKTGRKIVIERLPVSPQYLHDLLYSLR